MRARLAEWARRASETLPARCVRRFVRIDGRNRSLILAGQAFTTIIPLLIITAAAASASGGRSVGDRLVAQFHLSGDSADAMRSLFGRPPDAGGAMSLVGLVVLLASLLSLTRSLQRTYEAAWDLPPRGLPGTVNGLTGMSLLIAQVIVLALLTSALRGVPAGSVIAAVGRFALAIPLWLVLQHLLLSRRVPIRALLPGAVVVAVGQVVVSGYSTLWMPRLVATDAARYGLIGVTFALISWLIVVSLAVVAGAVVAAELAPRASPAEGQGGGATAEDGDESRATGSVAHP
jgi:membrane protein